MDLFNELFGCSTFGYAPSIPESVYSNVFYQRCNAIKDELKKQGLPCTSVCRHSLFNVGYYQVHFEDIVKEEDIAKALNIPEEWIGLVTTENWMYYIKEEELNDKYCDEDGDMFIHEEHKLFSIVRHNVVKDRDLFKITTKITDCPLRYVSSDLDHITKVCDFLNELGENYEDSERFS